MLQADGSLWHSMLERDSVPQPEEAHSVEPTDQAAWGKASQAYVGDLFGNSELPESWVPQVLNLS